VRWHRSGGSDHHRAMAGTRPARPDERFDIQSIATAAGLSFSGHPDPRIAARADDPPPSLDRIGAWIDSARVWVATDSLDEPVGFVVLEVVDGLGHVEEMSVRPDHQGVGHGSALLEEAAVWCVGTARPGLTLTTFDDVEWNRPYYERRGFEVLAEDEVGPQLRAKLKQEAERGLDPDLRVCMRRDLS
jgi:GNAT superfamily N-acetyltransferase